MTSIQRCVPAVSRQPADFTLGTTVSYWAWARPPLVSFHVINVDLCPGTLALCTQSGAVGDAVHQNGLQAVKTHTKKKNTLALSAGLQAICSLQLTISPHRCSSYPWTMESTLLSYLFCFLNFGDASSSHLTGFPTSASAQRMRWKNSSPLPCLGTVASTPPLCDTCKSAWASLCDAELCRLLCWCQMA